MLGFLLLFGIAVVLVPVLGLLGIGAICLVAEAIMLAAECVQKFRDDVAKKRGIS